MSNYKIRLLEKQRLRFSYWISEKQFRRYAKKAFGQPGNTGENLLRLLERRLDNAVYRFGFAPTILSARQMISHGHILVNGSKMDKPSYMVRQADLVSVREGSKRLPLVEEGVARSQARPQLSYFEFDRKNLRGTLTEIPSREQIPLAINEALVVEYYAKYI